MKQNRSFALYITVVAVLLSWVMFIKMVFLFVFQYLYLLFSDDSLMSLDEWVYNTEAHPLPIKGVNPLYREQV
jgi:hypothetical protein